MDLSVVVGSCDKYSFLWDKFTKRFNKYWNLNVELKKYLISETVEFSGDTFETIKCGKVPYTECLKKSLETINTKYILWLQDDYFLVKKLDSKIIYDSYNLISETLKLDMGEPYGPFMGNIIRVGIHLDSKYYRTTKYDTFNKYSKNSMYTVSMQSSIWDRKKLLEFLKESPDENPWEFEVNGSKRLNATDYEVFFYKLQEAWYEEAMKKGVTTKIYNE